MDGTATPIDLELARNTRDRNHASYRQVGRLMGAFIDESMPVRLRCECGRADCKQSIDLTLAQQREARKRYPRSFTVARKHIHDTVDKVQFRDGDFALVLKEI